MKKGTKLKERRVLGAPKAFAETNRFREEMGMKPILVKERKCLACGKKFMSTGNRTCGCISEKTTGSLVDMSRV